MRPLAFLLLLPLVAVAQPPDFPAPKTYPPDEATLKKIKDKTSELKKAIGDNHDPDVVVYLKAAEWIVKHEEWFTEKSADQTLAVLDAGLERAKNADTKPWLAVRGKPVLLGYRSPLDNSVQPYAVRFPDDFDLAKRQRGRERYRADVVLHGRDATLTEVKFIHARETAKEGKPLDRFEVEVYGRGNNAYRWAGETDVLQAMAAASRLQKGGIPDWGVLRGFSMGGAGTWHIGLHHPFVFRVLGPGAGFSTTRGYIGEKKFGPQPDYIEKCLRIYDAVDYAENAFNVPVVAYSGEKDKQKLAADLIEAKLKDFKETHTFKHLVASGLEHSQPAEWLKKLDDEYTALLKNPRPSLPERLRLVTYTPRYNGYHWVASEDGWARPLALEKQYEKAVVDASVKGGAITVSTTNVRLLLVDMGTVMARMRLRAFTLTVDGQEVPVGADTVTVVTLEKADGRWVVTAPQKYGKWGYKWQRQCGPIDDAFTRWFRVVPPSGKAWHEEPAAFADARRQEFTRNWDKHFRGEVRTIAADELMKQKEWGHNVVLFGDPQSNPAIAEVLPKLPITWTKDKLVVNGKEYDPKTHLPVLIYPNPKGSDEGYVVINSGHTFREADFKGTNALLYPRLGDWAVLKPKPTKDDPAGFEVVDAGLFDENWQFPKKK